MQAFSSEVHSSLSATPLSLFRLSNTARLLLLASGSCLACGDGAFDPGAASDAGPGAAQSSESTNAARGSSGEPTADSSSANANGIAWEGRFTLGEWDVFDDVYTGILEVEARSGVGKRFGAGTQPSRHESGQAVYLGGCGDYRLNRVLVASAEGLPQVVTACSGELPNLLEDRPMFLNPELSPEADRVAVTIEYQTYDFSDSIYLQRVSVFDLEGRELRQFDENLLDPTWTPDGNIVAGSWDGLHYVDLTTGQARRIDGGALAGAVREPDVHPNGELVVFAFNQRLWQIRIDGSDLQEVASGATRLSYPAYSPDGTAIAFLSGGDTSNEFFDKRVVVRDLTVEEERYSFIDLVFDFAFEAFPTGPLSWTSY